MRPFFLRSERIGFGIWSADDLDLATALWGDDRVTRRIGGPFDPRERLAAEMALAAAHGIQYWPIFRLADGVHLGCAGLRPHGDDELELGVHLRFDRWGAGYATEAARAVIDHAIDDLGAPSLFAGHHPENESSRRLIEKLGFRPVGDELYPPTGLLHPAYRLTRADREATSAG